MLTLGFRYPWEQAKKLWKKLNKNPDIEGGRRSNHQMYLASIFGQALWVNTVKNLYKQKFVKQKAVKQLSIG